MRTSLKFLGFAVSALFMTGLVLSGCADLAKSPPTLSLQQRIEAAHTRADHEALVAYYDGEAATATAKAAEHRDMIKSYQQQVAKGHGNANMETHCKSLIRGYEDMAAEYAMLAAHHRQMAAMAYP